MQTATLEQAKQWRIDLQLAFFPNAGGLCSPIGLEIGKRAMLEAKNHHISAGHLLASKIGKVAHHARDSTAIPDSHRSMKREARKLYHRWNTIVRRHLKESDKSKQPADPKKPAKPCKRPRTIRAARGWPWHSVAFTNNFERSDPTDHRESDSCSSVPQ
ncbi:putative mitochondrial Complex I, B14_14kd subunit [Pseudozyma hubeiensis]|nr:putative mitochondrial Complex I, B14_14kd subunit [Pseudozyma hubeiensis]